MTTFTYVATDVNGKKVKGTEMAEDSVELIDKLRQKGLFCTSYKDAAKNKAADVKFKFKTKDLSKQIGSSRLSFAPAEYMEKYLGVTPGSATLLGLMHDPDRQVQLIIDEEVTAQEEFGCHPCINTSSLKLRTKDVLEKLIPALGHEPVFVKL